MHRRQRHRRRHAQRHAPQDGAQPARHRAPRPAPAPPPDRARHRDPVWPTLHQAQRTRHQSAKAFGPEGHGQSGQRHRRRRWRARPTPSVRVMARFSPASTASANTRSLEAANDREPGIDAHTVGPQELLERHEGDLAAGGAVTSPTTASMSVARSAAPTDAGLPGDEPQQRRCPTLEEEDGFIAVGKQRHPALPRNARNAAGDAPIWPDDLQGRAPISTAGWTGSRPRTGHPGSIVFQGLVRTPPGAARHRRDRGSAWSSLRNMPGQPARRPSSPSHAYVAGPHLHPGGHPRRRARAPLVLLPLRCARTSPIVRAWYERLLDAPRLSRPTCAAPMNVTSSFLPPPPSFTGEGRGDGPFLLPLPSFTGGAARDSAADRLWNSSAADGRGGAGRTPPRP